MSSHEGLISASLKFSKLKAQMPDSTSRTEIERYFPRMGGREAELTTHLIIEASEIR